MIISMLVDTFNTTDFTATPGTAAMGVVAVIVIEFAIILNLYLYWSKGR